jgi:hypothetical protein
MNFFKNFDFSLLRCQAGEEEIDFFTEIQQKSKSEKILGNVSISNLRIIWYNPENASVNFSLNLFFSALLFEICLIVIASAFGFDYIIEIVGPCRIDSGEGCETVLFDLIYLF